MTEHTVKHSIGGRSIEFTFSECRAHTSGEEAGNLDVTVVTEPHLEDNLLVDGLALKFRGEEKPLEVVGYLGDSHHLHVTFSSQIIFKSKTLPFSVELFLIGPEGAELRLAEVPCREEKNWDEKVEDADDPHITVEGKEISPSGMQPRGCLGVLTAFGVGLGLTAYLAAALLSIVL